MAVPYLTVAEPRVNARTRGRRPTTAEIESFIYMYYDEFISQQQIPPYIDSFSFGLQ